jgi:cellulose 1,4-beta-cellobiosidase
MGPALASGWGVGVAGGSSAHAQARTATAATGLSAACVSTLQTMVKLTWTAAAGATSYTVEVSTTSASTGYSVAASGVTATTWTSGTLVLGNYYYEVVADFGAHWVSPASAASGETTIAVAGCIQP